MRHQIVKQDLGNIKIHTYIAGEDSFGDATHIIESPNYLTIIDTQYTIPYSREFRRYADSLSKPIAGVIISHAHPDHYFGLSTAFSDVPSYALEEVRDDIMKNGPTMISESKQSLKDLVPDKVKVPDRVLYPGEITVDGVRYRYKKYNKAEADTQLVIELPDFNTVIVQDAVSNKYHPWMGQWTDGWIRLLNMLSIEYKNDTNVLVGHGNPGSPNLYNKMKQYLIYADKTIKNSKGDKNFIFRMLKDRYPDYKGRQIIPMYLNYMFP